MSRARHNHLVATDHGEDAHPRWTALCGRQVWRSVDLTDKATARAVCPDCAKLHWGELLRREPNGYTMSPKGLTEAEREAVGSRWSYRAMFAVTGPEGHMGFIALRNGFGKGYAFTNWRVVNSDEATASGELHSYSEGIPRTYQGAATFVCKEQALYFVSELVGRGLIQDRATVEREALEAKAAAIARRAREAVEATQREAQRAILMRQREAETQHVAAAFRELFASETVSNFQREGLVLAARRLNLDLDKLQAAADVED